MFLFLVTVTALGAEPRRFDRFERQTLTDTYYSEGANVGDLNRDGKPDIVHGPYWFEGPAFQTKHLLYPAKAQPRERYADNFFSWVYDFNADGWSDVLVVGFPGTPAYVYENPAGRGFDQLWTKHEVFDQVANESPQFVNLVGDAKPELVCTHDGYWGYATIDWSKPFQKWQFHNISKPTAPKPFGHGLGIGDVDGDSRLDILGKDGWYQQPASLANDPAWTFHPVSFARAGGAEMYAYDVDGDGDNDVITSLAAHEFGLAWYEQLQDGNQRVFRQHLILGATPAENPYGVLFSELHSLRLADIDGDGLQDIVTGKTYWSHHTQSPLWDAGAVVYWFRLVRTEEGVDWVPYQADGEAGIGRQIVVADVNGDQLPDIVTGGMRGCHILIHRRQEVDEATWRAAQPQRRRAMADGLPPEQAAANMTVPPGFQVQLAAGEPLVHQPVAFAIDARGRVWVAEAYTYPIRAPEGEGKDKIIILEDTNGDGTLDDRKVFATGLNLVSGLEVGFGGVWVGAAPYLLFLPDKDHDDVPDGSPQVILDGFGFQDTHETLNAFLWGPDGWLYGCHGVFTHSRVGKPGTPDEQRTPLNAGIWRFHPQRHEFEVFAWGTSNPWGVDFNDLGQAFCTACVIPHLFHVVQGGRYERQAGQHFDAYAFDDIKTIADHAHYAGDIRDHAWWGHEPTNLSGDTSAAGGGHAHCGAMVYLGDNWPAEYRNQLFFNNVHGNRVNNDRLERRGSGYVGRHNPDLLMANDHWFRGINLKCGPDGSVYLTDWYDKNACHRATPEIWDRTNGRIYRISYGGQSPGSAKSPGPAKSAGPDRATAAPRAVPPQITSLSEQQLVALHTQENDWYARMARRLLQERGLTEVGRKQLQTWLVSHDSLTVRLRSLWTLHATNQLTEEDCRQLLGQDNEHLRAWAIQLAAEDRRISAEMWQDLGRLAASDPSPVVRLYLAAALQRLPLEPRWAVVASLVKHAEDAEDHNLPLMYWYAIEPLVGTDAARALELGATSKIPLITRFIWRRVAADNKTLDLVVSKLTAGIDQDTQRTIAAEILAAFAGRVNVPMPPSWGKAFELLSASDQQDLRDLADQIAVVLGDRRIFPRMRALVIDKSKPAKDRKQALDILVRGRDDQAGVALRAVLPEEASRAAAVRALASIDDPQTPPALLAAYSGWNDEEKRDAISTLVSRPSFALALLDAVQQQRIPRADLHAYHIRQLAGFGNEALNERIKQAWGDIRETNKDKLAQIDNLRKLLRPNRLRNADAGNGRRLFVKNCATCHTLFGEGNKVGPDITGSNRANLEYILENVLDPSAVLGKDYRMTVLACADGRVVSGLVLMETDSAYTVRTINDTVVVPKADVEERKLSDQSLMPERLLDSLTPSEICDLVVYLGSPAQVPLRYPRATIDPATKRVLGSLEGESMKVLNKPDGSANSQKMGAFTKDAWSGVDQLWWTGAKPGSRLELALPVAEQGRYQVQVVLTKARDYGIVQLAIDDQKLGGPIDLYESEVVTTGVIEFDGMALTAGEHRLSIEIVGANPEAAKAYMVGLDYVRLQPAPDASRR